MLSKFISETQCRATCLPAGRNKFSYNIEHPLLLDALYTTFDPFLQMSPRTFVLFQLPFSRYGIMFIAIRFVIGQPFKVIVLAMFLYSFPQVGTVTNVQRIIR